LKSSISNFTQIRLVGAALTHADKRTVGHKDGQTNMAKLTSAFRNYANTPKTTSISRTAFQEVVRSCPYALQGHK